MPFAGVNRIRDHMDEICEGRGFYRKHVAAEPDAIFRSVSDVVFGTQARARVLQKAAFFYQRKAEGLTLLEGLIRAFTRSQEELTVTANDWRLIPHANAHVLAAMLDVTVDILETTNSDISTIRITPSPADFLPDERFPLETCLEVGERGERDSVKVTNRGSSAKDRVVLLCFSAPRQYDPVYSAQSISTAGLAQSILYEMIYVKLFRIDDAFEASEVMLFAEEHFNGLPKPERYDKDFVGTAMEALASNLIPFPYKVAKVLDPSSYRNIEYDVWTCERKGDVSNPSTPGSTPTKQRFRPSVDRTVIGVPIQTIGSLPPGTPCLVRVPKYEFFGKVIKPTSNRKRIEVHVPDINASVFVERKQILPVVHFPTPELEFKAQQMPPYLPVKSRHWYPNISDVIGSEVEAGDNQQCRRGSGLAPRQLFPDPAPTMDVTNEVTSQEIPVEELQKSNMRLTASQDPFWLQKFNFSVPPPEFYRVSQPFSTPATQAQQPQQVFQQQEQHNEPNLQSQSLAFIQQVMYQQTTPPIDVNATPTVEPAPPQSVLAHQLNLGYAGGMMSMPSAGVNTPLTPVTPTTPFWVTTPVQDAHQLQPVFVWPTEGQGQGQTQAECGYTHPSQPASLIIPPVTPTTPFVNYPLTPITTPMMHSLGQMGGFTFPAGFSAASPFPLELPPAATPASPPTSAEPVTPKLDANAIRNLFAFPPLPTSEAEA